MQWKPVPIRTLTDANRKFSIGKRLRGRWCGLVFPDQNMNSQPIHQNLSTSFVNLSALVRHLRRLQFTGSVRLELSSYEAEIIFTQKNRVQAREYDRLAGRISQGEEAFKRILTRSREPFGRIQVLRIDPVETANYLRKPFVDDRIIADAKEAVFGSSDKQVLKTIIGPKWIAYRPDKPSN